MSWLPLLCVSLCIVKCAPEAVTATGIDFGFERLKTASAVGKPGPIVDVVLNERGERKTLSLFTFNDDSILVGVDAANLRRRFPSRVLGYPQHVLGRAWADPRLMNFTTQHAFALEEDHHRHTANYQLPGGAQITPEEVGAVLLRHQARLADPDGSGMPVVIAVPPFMTYNERRAVLDAADLANIRVVSIINDNVAVAIHYGVGRTIREKTSRPRRVLFYDMGAGSTKVSLVEYSADAAKAASAFKNRLVKKMHVKSLAFDESLGGYQFDLRMAALLGEMAAAQATDPQLLETEQTWLKLMEKAQKAKEMLSANTAIHLTIDALFGDEDFRAHVTREEFYERCADLFARAMAPVTAVLRENGLHAQDLDDVVMVGGGTRMPRVVELLREHLQRPGLEHTVNAEEAVVLGAAYLGATLDGASSYSLSDSTTHSFPIHVLRAPRPDPGNAGAHPRVDDVQFLSTLDYFAPFNATEPRQRMASMIALDARKRRRAAARHELESFIYSSTDQLAGSTAMEGDPLAECCARERERALAALDAARDWLEHDDEGVRNSEHYSTRIRDLRRGVDPLLQRLHVLG